MLEKEIPEAHSFNRNGWHARTLTEELRTLKKDIIDLREWQLNCVHLIDAPLTKKWNNFSSFGSFGMFWGVLESRGVGATFAFGFEKKYLFSKKLEHKTFCVTFFISRFWGFFFQKKSQNRLMKNVTKNILCSNF